MIRYLLDTTLLAAYLARRQFAVALISPWISNQEAATSILAYGEVVEHLKGKPNFPQHHSALRHLLEVVQPYMLALSILDRYADIRRVLRPPYGPGLIGDMDTLIAATAVEFGLTLVTTDQDFQRVPDLNVLLAPRR